VIYDIVIRNAVITTEKSSVEIGVDDGIITKVGTDLGSAEQEINAAGALVAGGFVDPHVHLDKALLADKLPNNGSQTLAESIRHDRERKNEETIDELKVRAKEVIRWHVKHGCTRIRTHVDVDPVGEMKALKAILAVKNEYSDLVDLQIVVFPQDGVYCSPPTEELLEKAVEYNIDAIGAIPAIERTDEEVKKQIETILSLAQDHDLEIDAHIDETDDPNAQSLEYLAARTIDADVDVTVGHACALAAYDETHAQRVISLVAEADITVITNPGTNLILQGRNDQHPKRRGITRVDQLRDAGVTIAAGQDNIRDAFYEYNRGDMLETAHLAAHAAHLHGPNERRAAWDMVTKNAASVLGVEHGIATGKPATFNVFSESISTPTEAICEQTPPRFVLHDGSIVAETNIERRLNIGE
jgi:cytosine deaminase